MSETIDKKVNPVEDAQAILRLLLGKTADASVIPNEGVQPGPTAVPAVRWECDEGFLG